MRKFYTVFDRDNHVIGFALSKDINEKIDTIITTPYDDEVQVGTLDIDLNKNAEDDMVITMKEDDNVIKSIDETLFNKKPLLTFENFLQISSQSFLKDKDLDLDII